MIDLVRPRPADPAVEAGSVVLRSPVVDFPTEVAERSEVYPSHELLGEDPVEPLELPSPSWGVQSPVGHRDASGGAELPELLRDETSPVVDVEGLGLAAGPERPPKVVRGLASLLVEVGAGPHEVPGPIVQDGVHVDVASNPGDAELVDIHLPEGVDVSALEPLEGDRFLDGADHEPVALQHPVDGDPAHPDPPPSKDGVDAEDSPRRVFSPQLEDSIDEVPVDAVRAVMSAPGLVPEALHTSLSVVSAPVAERPLGDSQELADLRGSYSPLEMLLDGV